MSRTPLPVRLTIRTAAIAVAVVTAILYLLTMSRTFGFIDGGEMAAAASTLGIPHPTGYPLLMILGNAAVALLPFRDVTALNVLAALLAGAGAGVLTALFNVMLNFVWPRSDDEPAAMKNTVPYAACGGLLTAMTPVWWGQGVQFEAYALHALLLPLVLLSFARYVTAEDESVENNGRFRITRRAFFFSLVLGLSFSNHLTTVVLAPALLGWFFYRFGFGRGAWLRLASFVPGVLVGLLPYLYLPLRSAADPVLNWGMPTTAGRFIDHVSGAQFREYMFEFDAAGRQLGWYFGSLPSEFAYVGLLLAAFGLYVVVRRCRPVAALSGMIFLTCIVYAGTYAIKEIEPYFMAATLIVGFWAAVGLLELGRRFGSTIALPLGASTLLLAGVLHWNAMDRSDVTMPEDVARDMLESLPRDAVLFTTYWDILHSGILYLQNVENVRPDVAVVNVNMLPDRVYLSQVLERNPVFKNVSGRIRAFVNERKLYDLRPETRGYRNRAYQTAFYRMVNGIIATCGRPVFVTDEVDRKVGYGWYRIPQGLALRLTPDSTYLPGRPPTYRLRLPSWRFDPDVMKTCLFYTKALLARSRYEEAYGRNAEAEAYMRSAAAFDPGIDPDDVPPLPMGNRTYVKEGATFYRGLTGGEEK